MGYVICDSFKFFHEAYSRMIHLLVSNPTQFFALIVADPDIQPYQVHNVTAKTQHGWLTEHPTHHIMIWPTKALRGIFNTQTSIIFPQESPDG